MKQSIKSHKRSNKRVTIILSVKKVLKKSWSYEYRNIVIKKKTNSWQRIFHLEDWSEFSHVYLSGFSMLQQRERPCWCWPACQAHVFQAPMPTAVRAFHAASSHLVSYFPVKMFNLERQNCFWSLAAINPTRNVLDMCDDLGGGRSLDFEVS